MCKNVTARDGHHHDLTRAYIVVHKKWIQAYAENGWEVLVNPFDTSYEAWKYIAEWELI